MSTDADVLPDPSSSTLTVAEFDGPPDEWDAVVAQWPGGGVFHLHAWHKVMKEGLGHTAMHVGARDADGTLVGILPLVRVRSLLFGDYLISMPFLNEGGPVGRPEARRMLGEWATEEARKLGVDMLELRNAISLPGDLDTMVRKITVKLSLPDDSKVLWEDVLRSKVRSQVRRPMKEGMEAHVGGVELLDDFYEIFAITMRSLGTPVLPKAFFEAICRCFPEEVLASTIEYEGQVVAAGFGFLHKGRYEITWAGSLREHSRLAPNMLLYWSLMEACVERGVEVFDFGRCTPGSGTHRFKKQWGGDDHPLPWSQWSPSGDGGGPPNPDDPKYRMAVNLWTRLPLPVTRIVGPRISRLLP